MRSNRKKVNFNSANSMIYNMFLLHNRNLPFSKDLILIYFCFASLLAFL